MAFVKLPTHLRHVDEAGRAEFILFVGAADAEPSNGVLLSSAWETHRLAPGDVPIDFRPGELAAVLAVAPASGETGPIIAAANLDTDERADLLAREVEIAALIRRRGGPRTTAEAVLRTTGAGALSAAAVGVGVYAASAVALAFLRAPPAAAADPGVFAGPAAAGPDLRTILAAAFTQPDLEAAAPAALAATLAFAAGVFQSVRRQRNRRRRLRAALDLAWRRATDVFVFARRHADAFRAAPRLERNEAPLRPRPRPRADRVDGRSVARRGGEVRWPDHLSSQ